MARWTGVTTVGLLLASGACTLLLDRNPTQCQTDNDCLAFGNHPACRGGACVDSGVGPEGCFFGTPQQPQDFLNQCSTTQWFDYDDCTKLHVCGDAAGPPLVAPMTADGGTTTDAANDGATPEEGGNPNLPSCSEFAAGTYSEDGTPKIVYVTGSSNFPPLLQRLANLIVGGAGQLRPGPAVIYQQTNACTGAARVFTSNRTMSDPLPGSTTQYAKYYAPDGGTVPCLLGPGGATVDVGESDVYGETCNPIYTTGGGSVVDSQGPIQAMGFVVPSSSDQVAISQEAAREVFGIGGSNGVKVDPWTNPEQYFTRNRNTGTQQLIGMAIGVPPDKFWGVDKGSAQGVHDAIQAINANMIDAEHVIGIISVDGYDADRGNLKLLAYKADGQAKAYLPDSSPTAQDKQNVRDGHYPIWGPLHFFLSGVQPSLAATSFVDYLVGTSVNQAVLDAFIASSLVPVCAMSVSRARNSELAELKAFVPDQSCGCYFQAETQSMMPPECTRCQSANDCPATRSVCNFNWCEIR